MKDKNNRDELDYNDSGAEEDTRYLLIHGLLSDAVYISDYVASDSNMILNTVQETMSK